MKRGSFLISGELLIQALGMPKDFKISGVQYDPRSHTIRVSGYSKSYPFHEVAEGAYSMDYTISEDS